jgi:hypothetical protein
MNDPKKVIEALDGLLYEMEKVHIPSEKAAIYAAARWLIADLEAVSQRLTVQTAIAAEGILRLQESFGGFLGTEPVNPGTNLTAGAMGISQLKNLLPQLVAVAVERDCRP